MVEIAPATHLDPQLRSRLTSDSVKLAKQVRTCSQGHEPIFASFLTASAQIVSWLESLETPCGQPVERRGWALQRGVQTSS